MNKIKLQDLFYVPLNLSIEEISKCPDFIKLDIDEGDSSRVSAYLYTAPNGNYLDLGKLFTELQINVFNDNSYRLIFYGNVVNCKEQPFTARIVFYNALHKILGKDNQGAENFTLTDFATLQFGGERLFSKWWGNGDAILDVISEDNPIEFSIDSHFIEELLDVEIENTQDLCKIKQPENIESEPNMTQTQNSGCLSVIIIAIVLSALFAI